MLPTPHTARSASPTGRSHKKGVRGFWTAVPRRRGGRADQANASLPHNRRGQGGRSRPTSVVGRLSFDTESCQVLAGHNHPTTCAVDDLHHAIRRRDDNKFHFH